MHRISLRLTNQPPQSSVQFTWPMCINNIFPIEKLASWLQYLNKTLFITTQEWWQRPSFFFNKLKPTDFIVFVEKFCPARHMGPIAEVGTLVRDNNRPLLLTIVHVHMVNKHSSYRKCSDRRSQNKFLTLKVIHMYITTKDIYQHTFYILGYWGCLSIAKIQNEINKNNHSTWTY